MLLQRQTVEVYQVLAWNGTKPFLKDWGGQAMNDYLSAIDDVSKEKYVDTARRGAVRCKLRRIFGLLFGRNPPKPF